MLPCAKKACSRGEKTLSHIGNLRAINFVVRWSRLALAAFVRRQTER
jgi:hypothetical protein